MLAKLALIGGLASLLPSCQGGLAIFYRFTHFGDFIVGAPTG